MIFCQIGAPLDNFQTLFKAFWPVSSLVSVIPITLKLMSMSAKEYAVVHSYKGDMVCSKEVG